MKTAVKLKIADKIISMQSNYALKELTKEEKIISASERYGNFLFFGNGKKPDISINVEMVDRIPKIQNAKHVFTTYHFENGEENWRLLKKGDSYIYKCPLEDKKQLMLVNKTFDKVNAYLLPKKGNKLEWEYTDIVYDFLQVLLINYFALRNQGIFTHSIGLKDSDGSGIIFTGKSGAGKSTTARLWHKNTKAMVLNDDRIIVRKIKGKFFIYGSPWHGDFADYLDSKIGSACLKKIFFIYHSSQNEARRISEKEAFNFLYPALFPTFWDKDCLNNTASFTLDLITNVPCYSLGFVNDKKVIDFVRKAK